MPNCILGGESMLHGPSFWFDTRIYLSVTAALLVVVAYYNHYFAVLGLIILVALYYIGGNVM
jgi:uncharacterized membrane-anchored protein